MIALLLCFSLSARAADVLIYEGFLTAADGTPINGTVNMKFAVASSGAEHCRLYSEDRSVVVSQGVFSVAINGSGGTRTDTTGLSFNDALISTSITGLAPGVCFGAATSVNHSGRQIELWAENEFVGVVAMGAVPQARNASLLAGKTAGDFVQINTSDGVTQTNLQSIFQRYTALDGLLNGTYAGNAATATTAVTATSATTVTGMVAIANGGTGASTAASARTNLGLGSLSTLTPSGTANSTTYLRGDGQWVVAPTPSVTVSGGDVSGTVPTLAVDRIKGIPLVYTTLTSGQTLRYNGTNWVNATPSDNDSLAALNCASGEVPQFNGTSWVCKSASAGSTNNTLVLRDGSAGVKASGYTGQSMTFENAVFSSVQFVPSTLTFASYVLTWPTTAGNAGNVLVNSGSGLLTWAPLPASPATCTAGTLSRWDGTAWVCESPVDATKLPLAGGTLSGALNLPANGLVVGTSQLVAKSTGIGVGVGTPAARVHLGAGTAAVGGAPLKFSPGALTPSPENGTIEYDGTDFYVTPASTTRKKILTLSAGNDLTGVANITGATGVPLTILAGSSNQNLLLGASGTGQVFVSSPLNINTLQGNSAQVNSILAGVAVTTPFLAGSDVSGGSIKIVPTTHATKGSITLGEDPAQISLGIGTTSPQDPITVYSTKSSGVAMTLGVDGVGANQQTRLNFATKIDGATAFGASTTSGWRFSANGAGYVGGGGNAEEFGLSYLTMGTTKRIMHVLPSGKVGINTIAPSESLEVSGASIHRNADNEVIKIGAGLVSGEKGLFVHYDHPNDRAVIQAELNGTGPRPMLLNPNGGNVGIGIGGPSEKLHVGGNVKVDGTLKVGSAGTGVSSIGVCTIASVAISTTPIGYTCPGLPGSTAIAISCSGKLPMSTATNSIYCRPSGAAGSVICNTVAPNTTAMDWTCMWMMAPP